MKRRLVSLLMLMCLMLITGCAGNNPGAVPDEPIKVSDSSKATSSYCLEQIQSTQLCWFSQSAPVSLSDDLFLLGYIGDERFLYEVMQEGKLEVSLIASCKFEDEDWQLICSVANNLYIYDQKGNFLIEYSKPQGTTRRISFPEDIIPSQLMGSESTLYAIAERRLYALAIDNSSEMKVLYTLDVSPLASFGKLSDGTVVVCRNEDQTHIISTLNDQEKGWGESRYIDAECTIIGYGSNWDLYLQIDGEIYGLNYLSGNIQSVLDFSSLGLMPNGKICELQDGGLLYTGTSSTEPTHPFLLKPIEYSADQVVLVLATTSDLPPAVSEAVLAWNQQHPECVIKVKNYGEYAQNGDMRAAEMQLIADISSGNAPDIYNFSEFTIPFNESVFERRGLLEDLYPYIDSDPDLSRDVFFRGPLEAMETDGHLYQIVPSFSVLTTTAWKKDVGTPDMWNYSSFERVITGHEYYLYLFDRGFTRDDWLKTIINASGKQLIDWSTSQCYFDSEYFVHLIEISNTMPTESEYVGGSLSDLIQNSHALLFIRFIGRIPEIGGVGIIYGDRQYAFVGLPEIGNVLIPDISMSISSQTQYKPQCWQFIREFLLPGNPYCRTIPLRRDDAELQLVSYLDRLEGSPEEKEIRENAMRDFMNCINDLDALYQSDEQLWWIINDELSRYYAGQHTAEEAARAIQSRASLYLSEQS